jgi:hypothetical protein
MPLLMLSLPRLVGVGIGIRLGSKKIDTDSDTDPEYSLCPFTPLPLYPFNPLILLPNALSAVIEACGAMNPSSG